MKFLQTSLLATGLAVGSGLGATLSYSFTDHPFGANDSESIPLNKFDSSLGTLTGVDFVLTGEVAGNISFRLLSAPTSATVTLNSVDMDTEFEFTGPALFATTFPTSATATADGNVTSGGVVVGPVPPNDTETFSTVATSDTINKSYTEPGTDLSSFVGGALDTFNVDITSSTSFGANFTPSEGSSEDYGTSTFSPNYSGLASGTVTYTYEAIPEPSSFLAVFCLAGGLVIRRRH